MKRFKITDESARMVIASYKTTRNYAKTAEAVGCSYNTVQRICIAHGVNMGQGCGKRTVDKAHNAKVTDGELIEDAKKYSVSEIAKMRGMNRITVSKRLSRLGITARRVTVDGKGVWQAGWKKYTLVCKCCGEQFEGRTGALCPNCEKNKTHYKRAIAYGTEYDPHTTLRRVYDRDGGICQLCGKPTDWNAHEWGGHFGALYPTIDHIVPMSKGGAHTMDNVQLAHAICNSIKGNRGSEQNEIHRSTASESAARATLSAGN